MVDSSGSSLSSFSRQLRESRESAGLTQQELARQAGVSTAMVRDLEQQRTLWPRTESLHALCAVLGIDPPERAAPAGHPKGRDAPGDRPTGPISIGLLGPLRLVPGDTVIDLGSSRQRAVLGRLALSPGLPVARSELIELLWGDKPPPSAVNLIQTYVARLRRILQPGRSMPSGSGSLRSVGGGYRLSLEAEQLDLLRFRQLVSQARAVAATSAEKALAILDEALVLWHGDPLCNVEELRGHPLTEGLLNERIDSTIAHADLAAALGRHDRALPLLRQLAAAHLLHEPLHARLMLALAGCGLQAGALATFDGIRGRLADDLGIDPGPELVSYHQRVLRQQCHLPEPVAGVTAPAAPAPFQVPAAVADFTGRTTEIARLYEALHRDPHQVAPTGVTVCAISGQGGVGKTALAVQVAHLLRAGFPDGQLYLNLHGVGARTVRPLDALAGFLRALGVDRAPPLDEAECAALFRSALAGRRVLVVLDNARDAQQVRPLLPGTGGCAALVTSRRRLAGLEGAQLMEVDVLPEVDAVALLAAVGGRTRVLAEPQAAALLVRSCGHLPVAIRITASRLASRQGWTVQSIGDRLFDERRRLDELRVGDLDIRATFALSYQDLEAATARTFRLGALSPVNGVEVSAAAALLDRPPGEVEADLDLLVDVNLLESDGPSRYRYHDLLRLYATSLVMTEDPPEARAAAHRRLFDWYLGRVAALAQSQDPNIVRLPTDIPIAADLDDRATEWLDQELPAIVAAVEHAAVHGPRRLAWLLADQLRGFFFGNRHAVHWLATGQAGLAAARAEDDRLAQAAMHQTLGQAYWSIGEFARSLEDYHDGARLAQEVGWQAGAAYMRHNIGLVQLALGQRADAHDSYLRALSLSRGHGLRYVEAVTLNDLGMLRWETGELTEAAEFLDAALRLNREDGNTNGTVANLINLGTVLRELGRLPEARAQLELVIQLCEGARYSLLGVRDELSQIYASSGRVDDAIAFAEEALALARETQDRAYEAAVLTTLGEALLAGGRTTEAVTHLRLSHALACEVGAPFCQIRALVGLTRAATASGDPAAARTAAEAALRGARTGGYRMLEADALLALAGVDAAQGLADAAASGCRGALALYDHSGAVSRAASAAALLDSLSRCPAGHP